MSPPHRVPRRQRQLAALLVRLREQAGLTQAEVARSVHRTDSTISRIEGGQPPDIHLLHAMLDLYTITVDQWPPIDDMLAKAKEKGWWHAYGQRDLGYLSAEDEASAVRVFQVNYIPGLLQTTDYTRAVFAAARVPMSNQEVETGIDVRQRRQERLTGDCPLQVHAVIDEVALRCPIEPRIMRSQVKQIVERAALPNVTVQVLPVTARPHPGMEGSFIVLSFPDDPGLVYVEHAFGSVHLEANISAARLAFDHLAGLALSPAESIDMIERVAAEM
jgi:transcriptional regulator with XRE-family HTH domain